MICRVIAQALDTARQLGSTNGRETMLCCLTAYVAIKRHNVVVLQMVAIACESRSSEAQRSNKANGSCYLSHLGWIISWLVVNVLIVC